MKRDIDPKTMASDLMKKAPPKNSANGLQDSDMSSERIRVSSSLFTGVAQYENFNRYYEIYPSVEISRSPSPSKFNVGLSIQMPLDFEFGGQPLKTETFLKETETAALIVVKDGQIRHEAYDLTGGPDVKWLSMSVAKSVVSALVGVALEEGHIESIEHPITDYVPVLTESAYDGVRIKDILQMSSGARWSENYSDNNSDVVRFAGAFGRGESLNEFAASLVREFQPGTVNRYNSADTQVLGMLITAATGETIADYTREKLWHPMGAESEAYWLCDNDNVEMAFGGFNATARDYAKVGELFRKGGALNGQQIVPSDWVKASVTPDSPHLQSGRGTAGEFDNVGYGYQWWIPNGDEGEYSAVGVYNQFIYVNPTHGVVIVKLSASRNYAATTGETSKRQIATFEMFRAIIDAMSK